MRIVFLGSSLFSVPSLEKLINDGHEIVGVVCQPDKPNSRGNKIEISPVKQFALKNNLPVFQFKKIRVDGVETVKSLQPELMVVVSYGQILSDEVIQIPKHGTINVHGSLLPKYRGASPIASAILNGETTTGVTIMRIVKEVDAGDMFAKQEVEIDPTDTCGSLSQKLSIVGANLLSEVVFQIQNGNAKETPQNNCLATFTKMIKKEDGLLDFNQTANEIVNKVRAFNPSPSAFVVRGNDKIKIHEAAAVENFSKLKNGEIICNSAKEGLVIKCDGGAVKILKLQAPGGKILDAKNFLNGKKF